jgi:hypothetical protein
MLHVPAALPPPVSHEAEWAPELVWEWWRRESVPCFPGTEPLIASPADQSLLRIILTHYSGRCLLAVTLWLLQFRGTPQESISIRNTMGRAAA